MHYHGKWRADMISGGRAANQVFLIAGLRSFYPLGFSTSIFQDQD